MHNLIKKTVGENIFYFDKCGVCGERINSYSFESFKEKYIQHAEKHIEKSDTNRMMFPKRDAEIVQVTNIDATYDKIIEDVLSLYCRGGVCRCPFNDGFKSSGEDADGDLLLHIENTPKHVDALEMDVERYGSELYNDSRLREETIRRLKFMKRNYEENPSRENQYHMEYRNRQRWESLPKEPDITNLSGQQQKPEEDLNFIGRKRRGYKHQHNGAPHMERNYGTYKERRFMGKEANNLSRVIPSSTEPNAQSGKKNYMWRLIRHNRGRNRRRESIQTTPEILGVDEASTFSR